MSHHTFPAAGGLRGLQDQPEVLTRRLLIQLLGCHGLVFADPLPVVAETYERQGAEAGLRALNGVVARLAKLQPLLGVGVLRVTTARPRLTDRDRAAVLAALGLEDFRVFSDMIEWAEFIRNGPRAAQARFVEQAVEIHTLLGVPGANAEGSFPRAVEAVVRLAAAIIEISWQVAVCSRESSCDVFVGDELEGKVLASLLSRTLDAAPVPGVASQKDGRSRYMVRLAAGELPRLDTAHLTIFDALALRRDDAFERWRSTLEQAVDSFDQASVHGGQVEEARRRFTESMREASDRLRADAKKSKFTSHLTPQAVPAGVAVLGAAATAGSGLELSASGWAAAGVGAAVVWQWFLARRTTSAKVMQRYVAHFATQET